MSTGSLAGLLGIPMRVGTIRVGEVVGVFVDQTARRAIGLEVSTLGGEHRFVPWIVARHANGSVSVDSSLVIVDDGASYERLGARVIRDVASLGGVRATEDGVLESVDAVSTGTRMGTEER